MSNIRKKAKQVQCLKIPKIQKRKMVVNKQLSKPCNVSHINQTTDRDDKAHCAIALKLVRVPSFG